MKNFLAKKSKKKSITQLLILLMVVSLIAVILVKRKTINLVIDGKKSTIITYKETVDKILENDGILVDAKDKIQPALGSKINNNGTISIKRAVNVQIAVDGKNLTVKSAENTVDALLKVEGITLKPDDKVQPLKEMGVVPDMKVTIVRMDIKVLTESADIPFKEVVTNDNKLANSIRKTTQVGKPGEKTITTNVVYENGTEVSRTIVNETIVREPVNTMISQGTMVVVVKPVVKELAAPVVTISRGGIDSLSYSKIITARATAYAPKSNLSAYTFSGRKAVRDPNGYSTIAVDPNVIPIGSRVYIDGYGLAYAADIGSAIKGNTIDVFFNTLAEAHSWGVKSVTVYILK